MLVGEPLRVHVELPNSTNAKFADLLILAADLPVAPSDLAAQHNRYLYGTPETMTALLGQCQSTK